MKMANTVELKNKTNEILRRVVSGEPVIITLKGKPAAAITPLTEDGLEDFIMENSPAIRKKIAKAEEDLKAGRVVSLDDYLSERK
ncbi:MAG: type II toxin-antitoxin system prevent-host-death family antitoxin [Deltaproteobacteria bacterium]|nr:type II toxin-antitoxin system prevent-host-death family antitoxin [Deltaproteobacteria bacterium]